MKNSEIIKHSVDCGLAFMIAFLSAMMAVEEITIKVFIIAFMSAILVGVIKFQQFWSNEVMTNDLALPIKPIFF